MSLVDAFRAALTATKTPMTLEVSAGPQRLTCELSAIDSLACTFTSLELETNRLAGATPERLKELSQALSARLTYLLEPISPIEIDREQCVVQMRSLPPERDQERTSYYELVLRRGGAASLCRFSRTAGDVRQVVGANVTREVLLRLVGDLSAALA